MKSGEDGEVRHEVLDGAHAIDRAGGLLDGDDVRMLREPRDDRERNFLARAPRHVVEDDGQPQVGDRHEVAVEPFRVRLVVVGRHLEARVCAAHRNRRLRERDGLGGRVRARARDDLDLARREFDGLLDHLVVLFVREGRRLAARPHRADALDAARDLFSHDGRKPAVVNRAVLCERGDHRRNGSRKFHDAYYIKSRLRPLAGFSLCARSSNLHSIPRPPRRASQATRATAWVRTLKKELASRRLLPGERAQGVVQEPGGA